MSELPKISIVTPSYNQGAFLEDTIKSVIEQDYPDFEYIVIDGGNSHFPDTNRPFASSWPKLTLIALIADGASVSQKTKEAQLTVRTNPAETPTITFTLEISGEQAEGNGVAPGGPFTISGSRTSQPEVSS